MKKISSFSAFAAYTLIAGLLFTGCKKENVSSLKSLPEVAQSKNRPPPPPPANPVIAYVSGSNLMVMNADGSNQTAIATAGGRPCWSPDGKHIVFVGGSPQKVYSVDVSVVNGKPTGTNLRVVPTNAPVGGMVVWSTGDVLAFPHGDTLYTVPYNNGNGGNATVVYTGGDYLGQPDWNPDGTRLVFAEREVTGGYTAIKMIDLTANIVTTIVQPSTTLWYSFPAWSRDGSTIALGVQTENTKTTQNLIYTAPAIVNSTPVKVTTGEMPAWSPDDTKLAIVIPGKSNLVYSYDFTTNTTQLLATGFWPSWAR